MDEGNAEGPEFPCAEGSCRSLPATSESVSAVKSSNRGGGECAVMATSDGWATTGESGLPLVQAALAGHKRILAQPKV